MVRYKQLKDVVRYIGDCHHAIAKLFEGVKQSHQREENNALHDRANLLLDYFSRQQTMLEEAINLYQGDAPRGVLDEWMDYSDGEDLLEYIESIDNHKTMSFDEVVDLTIVLERRIIKFAEDMADHVTSSDAKDAFNNIMNNEEKRLEHMIRQSGAFADL